MKRIFSFVLAIAMIFSMSAFTINAAPVETDYNDAASHLAALNILKGDGKGNMMLDQNVTRYQAALFFVQALTGKTEVEIWNADKNSTIFSDVTEYGTAIDYAYGVKLILGRGNGVYGPNDYITYQDMLVMAVRALGYETTDMSYPYGYILAAQKLGLTDDIDIVNYKTDLNRGATAQIMWNMLNTEVAYVDPLTDKVLYPGETGLTDTVTETTVDRKTLLEDSGLAGGKFTDYIVDFDEADADDDEDFDTVTLNSGLVLAAKDFDITADTPKVSYMGIPVDVYVDVDVDLTNNVNNFTQLAYDDGDAHIVFTTFATYTKVINLADGVIKYDANNACIYLDGAKFADNKYYADVFTFNNGVWTKINSKDTMTLLANFAYTSKDGYGDNANNTYCEVSYRVTDKTMTFDGVKKTCIEILYTPYEFGRYNVHTIDGVDYTVIGKDDKTTDEKPNYAGEKSTFVEKLIGFDNKVINDTTKTVANKYESAASVKVTGEAVTAGDFVYYNYNETDNILTIGMNCGNFQTGRLTSYSESKKTVKIDGVVYSIDGIKGFNYQTYINALEAGKDNAKFITVNGDITYIIDCKEDSDTNAIFDFAIISQDDEVIKSLLDDKNDYKTVNGVFYDGDVKVAMMNLTTGKWELITITGFATGNYVDNEFDTIHNIGEIAKYVSIFETDKHKAILADFAALNGIVAVVDTKDGYVIANYSTDYCTTGVQNDNGVIFSDNNNKTNAITADADVDAARVTVTDDTVIVVVDTTNGIGSRVGVQGKYNSISAGKVYAASSNLIVIETNGFDVNAWKGADVSNSDENWFITTVDTNVEVNVDDDGVYTFVIYSVFDMRNHEIVDIIVEGDSIDDVKVDPTAGNVIHMTKTGDIIDDDTAIAAAAKMIADTKDATYTALDLDKFSFVNGDTITIDGTGDAEAVDVKVTIITLFNFDATDYNLKDVASTDIHTGDDNNDVDINGQSYYEYDLDTDMVNVITEPDDAIFSDYAYAHRNIQIPTVDDKYENATVTFDAIYFVEDGIVDIIVYKTINLD